MLFPVPSILFLYFSLSLGQLMIVNDRNEVAERKSGSDNKGHSVSSMYSSKTSPLPLLVMADSDSRSVRAGVPQQEVRLSQRWIFMRLIVSGKRHDVIFGQSFIVSSSKEVKPLKSKAESNASSMPCNPPISNTRREDRGVGVIIAAGGGPASVTSFSNKLVNTARHFKLGQL